MSKTKSLHKVAHPDQKKLKETILALSTSPTQGKAAEKLGISRRALINRINKWELREYIAQMTDRAISSLQLGSIKAAENFVNKIDSRNENISMEASKEILDRVGIVKPSNTTNNVQVNVQPILEINPTVEEVKDE